MLRFKSVVVVFACFLGLSAQAAWGSKARYLSKKDVVTGIQQGWIQISPIESGHVELLVSDGTDSDGWPPVRTKNSVDVGMTNGFAMDGTDSDGWPPVQTKNIEPIGGIDILAIDGTDSDGWPPVRTKRIESASENDLLAIDGSDSDGWPGRTKMKSTMLESLLADNGSGDRGEGISGGENPDSDSWNVPLGQMQTVAGGPGGEDSDSWHSDPFEKSGVEGFLIKGKKLVPIRLNLDEALVDSNSILGSKGGSGI